MLNLTGTNSGDQTITLTGDVSGSGTGSFSTTIAANSVTMSKIEPILGNTLLGNEGVGLANPIGLNTTKAKTLLSIGNVENSALSTWGGSSNIVTVGAVSSGSLASGFGTINSGAITSDSLTAKTTNSNLTLNANGTGSIVTNTKTIYMANTSTSTDSLLALDGVTTSNNRFIGTYQNGALKCSFGLSGTSYYFVYDATTNNDMFKANLGGGQCIQFPTYSNGTLSITSGGILSSSSDRRLKTDEQALNPADSL
jgi:hypothetical protein